MFADPVDKASAIEEESRQRAIAAARANAKPTLLAKGSCHNCEEPVEDQKLFCDADCATDYEKYLRAQRMR
ncbi:conserved hypothetical protein [Alteromonas alvinellae]